MKVVASIRQIYEERLPLYKKLKEEVDDIFSSITEEKWHYESRIKEMQSFNMKIETGRYSEPSKLEDFFAASLVVENLSSLERAVNLIEQQFNVVKRRPEQFESTHKRPSDFSFDDLRLYLEIPEAEGLRPREYTGVLFELQVKTYLQHAWSIATHDLIYKSDEVSWSASRIAHQVKAMLEHSELSIYEARVLSGSNLLAKENNEYRDLTQIVEVVNRFWPQDQLPKDKVRLAQNVRDVFLKCRTPLSKFEEIAETSTYIGNEPYKNISPLIAITLSVIEYYDGNMRMRSNWNGSGAPAKLFLPDEAIELLPEAIASNIEEFRLQLS